VCFAINVYRCACRKADKTLVKKAMIAADEWARINLYQRQIGEREGAGPFAPSIARDTLHTVLLAENLWVGHTRFSTCPCRAAW